MSSILSYLLAGGAGALIQACPNATLLAHPRAARNLIDPKKLRGISLF